MSTVQCVTCNSNICLTDAQEREFRESHASFVCPLGHSQYFPGRSLKDRIKELERDVEIQERRAKTWQANYENLNEAVRLCPWPECGWETHAGWERVVKNLLRHLERTHDVKVGQIPRRLSVVA